MSQVTGGLVSIEDGIKRAEEYAPPRKVRVELSFSVGEGEDFASVFDTVSQAATNRVASLLGTTALTVVGAAPAAETPADPPATPPRRTRRTQAQIDADNAAALAAKKAGEAAAAADDLGETLEEPALEEPELEDEFTVQPDAGPEITDADLNSAVQKRNGELKNPDLIRGLIGSYNPDKTKVFQLRQIPQAERQGFLDKLAALTVAA